jgi:uncharacterized membrane protein
MARKLFNVGHCERGRVEAFSDGVLAIVITLLVLEIKIPPPGLSAADLWSALLRVVPMTIAWAVSFAFVLVFWVAHHYFFNSLKQVDRGLLWLNGLFLLTISFTPFPTAIAGEYPLSVPAAALLNAAFLVSSLAFLAMRLYATGRLTERHQHAAVRQALRRSFIGPILYAVGFVMAFVHPIISQAIQVIVPVIYFLPSSQQVAEKSIDVR